DSPKVMGIVNTTPDSFYSRSRTLASEVVEKVGKMLEEGADFVDVGGYSTRPGAVAVSEKEEIKRVVPIIELLLKYYPNLLISVDTFRSEVARQSLSSGAALVNDISAGNLDPQMWEIVAAYQVPYIAMHMQGTPQTMQQYTAYDDIVKQMLYYFSKRKAMANSYGINDFIIDPGFGFSKTLAQNYEILRKLPLFSTLDSPMLVGVSRKSMLYKLLGIDATQALNATTVVNTLAISYGANILRVHDVKEARQCVQIFSKMISGNPV
ncbi:MAG: dihydropteroate synthase, partial [Capnocytophaga sp.]|nr:dihydropteroate synthase [Capnocytophaga sp.]